LTAQDAPERERSLLLQRPQFPGTGLEIAKPAGCSAERGKRLLLKPGRLVVV
jgi:hypothetical protein